MFSTNFLRWHSCVNPFTLEKSGMYFEKALLDCIISPNLLVEKFWRKTQFSQSFHTRKSGEIPVFYGVLSIKQCFIGKCFFMIFSGKNHAGTTRLVNYFTVLSYCTVSDDEKAMVSNVKVCFLIWTRFLLL